MPRNILLKNKNLDKALIIKNQALKPSVYFFQLKKKQNLRNQLSLSSVNRQFKIFLLIALSFFTSLNLSANDTFFSIENSCDRIEELAKAGGSLLTKLDNALFSVLKGKVNQLDNVLKPQFLDDFANASDDVLKKLQNDNLFDVWKNDIRSNNIDELTDYLSKGNLRNDYISAVEAIENRAIELRNLGKTDIEIAQEVFELRRQTTIDFKNATPDDMLPWIFEFNDIRYTQKGLGDKWGLTWDGVVTKATKNGVTDYNRIITTAATPLGDKQVLGKALFDLVGDKTLPTLEKYRMINLIP